VTREREVAAWNGHVETVEDEGVWTRCKAEHGYPEEDFESYVPFSRSCPKERAVVGALFRGGVAKHIDGREYYFMDWSDAVYTEEDLAKARAEAKSIAAGFARETGAEHG
jgi:hypothetical protein